MELRKSSTHDEFYTNYKDIAIELLKYRDIFHNKIIYCPTDNPYLSDYTKFFLDYFEELHLKKLICTSYKKNSRGLKLEVTDLKNWQEVEETCFRETIGDGDFRSDECINFIKEADIIITTPPLELINEFVSLLNEYNKNYILLGHITNILDPLIFSSIVENKIKIMSINGEMRFRVDNDASYDMNIWTDDNGCKWITKINMVWFTNININIEHPYISYSERNFDDYSVYDNTFILHVPTVNDIPLNYKGYMGVPISYLKFFDNDKYELIGLADDGESFKYDVFMPTLDNQRLFKRLVIKLRR